MILKTLYFLNHVHFVLSSFKDLIDLKTCLMMHPHTTVKEPKEITLKSLFFLCFKTMSAKEKGKFEDLARQDKARYEREMMNYVPARGGKKKKFKDPNAPKRPP